MAYAKISKMSFCYFEIEFFTETSAKLILKFCLLDVDQHDLMLRHDVLDNLFQIGRPALVRIDLFKYCALFFQLFCYWLNLLFAMLTHNAKNPQQFCNFRFQCASTTSILRVALFTQK